MVDTGSGWDDRSAQLYDERVERTRVPNGPDEDRGRPAYLYKTVRTLRLRDIEHALRRVCAVTLRSRDRDLEVHAVRATSADGRSVRVSPLSLPEGLYLDHRDLLAIETGAIVPGLEDAVAALTRR